MIVKHIRQVLRMSGGKCRSQCGKKLSAAEMSETVEAALESDCDDCRVAVNVARVGDQAYGGGKVGVKKHPVYDPQPVVGAGGRLDGDVKKKRR